MFFKWEEYNDKNTNRNNSNYYKNTNADDFIFSIDPFCGSPYVDYNFQSLPDLESSSTTNSFWKQNNKRQKKNEFLINLHSTTAHTASPRYTRPTTTTSSSTVCIPAAPHSVPTATNGNGLTYHNRNHYHQTHISGKSSTSSDGYVSLRASTVASGSEMRSPNPSKGAGISVGAVKTGSSPHASSTNSSVKGMVQQNRFGNQQAKPRQWGSPISRPTPTGKARKGGCIFMVVVIVFIGK